MSVLILLGPPGAGRYDLSARLALRLGRAWVPARELLHSAALGNGSPAIKLGLYLAAGAKAPAALALPVLAKHLSLVDWRQGAVLSGFPQDLAQAQALDHWLAGQGLAPARAVRLELPREEVLRRLSGRRFCHRCPQVRFNIFAQPPREAGRCDECRQPLHQRLRDREDIVLRRLRQRTVDEMPLELYYRQTGSLEPVDAMGEPEEVLERIARSSRRGLYSAPDPSGALAVGL